jgi:hypothetical protein
MLWGHVLAANGWWLLASAAAVSTTFPLRTIRWRILLARSSGDVPFRPLWHATAIGFMANNILPARAGELVRSYAATRLVGVPFTTALASVAVERVFDGVVIGLLFALALAAPDFPAGAMIGTTNLSFLAALMIVLFAGVLAVCIAVVRNRERVLPLIERLLRRLLPPRLAELAVRIMHHATDGLAVLHSVRDVLRVLTWSFVVWGANTVAFIVGFRAFGLAHLPVDAALLLQGVVAFGVAVPQAPGFFGGFELLTRLSLALYGVPGDRALSYGFGIHIAWFVPITLWGLWLLLRTGLSLRDLRSEGGAR